MSNTSYYAKTAYGATEVPQQERSAERSWIMRLAKVRLPWGSPDEIAPASFLEKFSPKKLRLHEKSKKEREEQIAAGTYTSSSFEHVDFHVRDDHECFRYALFSGASHFWIYLYSIGKFLFWFSLFILLSISTLILINAEESWQETALNITKYSSITLGIPLGSWAIGKLVIDKFPNLWIKPSRGPIWELNRRTGLVTVFDYKNNGEYKKNGTIGELTAPFYEFDAYIATSPDSQGMPLNVLYLAHRYRNIMINFGALLCPGPDFQPPCALWDFIQNYMDVSRPLPDLPQYEEYRHLDPTTAEYDRLTGRNPRYWIDMDDATFKQIVSEMHQRVEEIDTFERPNLMAGYVTYVD
ncbi:hypothetical protein SAMN05216205_2829 [Pseudomonas mohnii]|uniref:Uncharacterized protein n=1 Tax=Pseudomonas mohnii TaxID=395600 RepID=A0ABY0XZN4_9PSED|nr:hypothetical protein [Pseudomonas mohnii]SEC63127.1 hypothetical protein SAMN05216205_2829 [Pseudomonas mohnii]